MELGNIVIENLQGDALNKPNSCDLRLGNTLYVFDYDIIDTKNSRNYLNEVLNDQTVNLSKSSNSRRRITLTTS